MTDLAIRAEHLSKRYSIGSREPYLALRDVLARTLCAPLSRGRRTASETSIWALRDVSLEVKRGEVLGIVGRNGAGKSTLLKLLSRITEPSAGRAEVRGRVGSLLEVGTGFHPELTGRENVFLNGAILGMKKSEIAQKFDDIVAFAGVERFIDTPVKYYSSGMYMRLAFAVAAHLEPNILLVDEVLAVGDVAFQQKCLRHLRTLTSSGMTILLVSHNMAAIQSSCHRAICLESGSILANGQPLDVIECYRLTLQRDTARESRSDALSDTETVAEEGVSIRGFEMRGEDGIPRRDFSFGERLSIRIDLHAAHRIETPLINFGIRRADGLRVCNFNNWYDNFKIDHIEGTCSLEGWLPPLRLVPDYYEAHVLVWPWGGGHVHGDLTRSRPLAARQFGEFCIHGPGLNSHDGVFQIPAKKWRFTSGEGMREYTDPAPTSLQEAFAERSTGDQ